MTHYYNYYNEKGEPFTYFAPVKAGLLTFFKLIQLFQGNTNVNVIDQETQKTSFLELKIATLMGHFREFLTNFS